MNEDEKDCRKRWERVGQGEARAKKSRQGSSGGGEKGVGRGEDRGVCRKVEKEEQKKGK